MKKAEVLILLLFFILFSQSSVFASQTYLNDSELKSFGFAGYEQINPNLLVYPIKRLVEEFKMILSSNKKEYAYKLYEVRLKELIYIVNNKKEGFLGFTVDRYNSFVGKIKKEYPLDASSKIKFVHYLKILERLRDIYPANSVHWIKIQQAIETTRSLI